MPQEPLPGPRETISRFEKQLAELARRGVDFDLDIFTRMRGKSIDDFRPRFRYIESGGVRIPCIAPEDLLFLKQGSWREKDQLDVAAMKEIIERERNAK